MLTGFKSGLKIWEKMRSCFLEMKDGKERVVGEEAGSLGTPGGEAGRSSCY